MVWHVMQRHMLHWTEMNAPRVRPVGTSHTRITGLYTDTMHVNLEGGDHRLQCDYWL